jgi:hypothetical protein
MVAIGTANAISTTTSGSPPFLLMQKSESYVKTNLQYSINVTPGGATFAVVEGGVNASIPQGFGFDPSITTGSNPRPTSGGGGSGGGSGGGGGGGSTVVVVPGKLSVKIIIIIVVAALVVGGGILFCFFGCIAGCCLGIKESITGKKRKEGGEAGAAAVVEVQPDWAKGQKAEEGGVVGTSAAPGTAGAGAYPVMTEYRSSGYAAVLPPPPAQDNELRYLITGAPPKASVTGSPPSPSIPRHSRPGV